MMVEGGRGRWWWWGSGGESREGWLDTGADRDELSSGSNVCSNEMQHYFRTGADQGKELIVGVVGPRGDNQGRYVTD